MKFVPEIWVQKYPLDSGSSHCECAAQVLQPAMHGARGTGAAGNLPGSRVSGAGWTDAAGHLWLFSGNGIDSTGAPRLPERSLEECAVTF